MLSRIRSAASREAGLAGIALVIVIAWALAAVMMLTGTLIAAQQIDDRVATILGEVSPIDDDLDSVKLAQETDRIAKDILTAAEPLSGQLDQVRDEIRTMRDLTDQPFGVNIAQLFVRDPAEIVEFVAAQGVRFVTTSAGDPNVLTSRLHDAGITVFHVVPHLRGALKAIAAGVDGLVVEGGEGGGFKQSRDVSTMVLLPLVCGAVDVPVIAAGGIVDGRSMAAAFVLGAEGVQLGTRMVSAAESPVHDNWKDLIVRSAETDSVMLNRWGRPAFRVLATPYSEAREQAERVDFPALDAIQRLYFEGDLDAAFAFGGQVASRSPSK